MADRLDLCCLCTKYLIHHCQRQSNFQILGSYVNYFKLISSQNLTDAWQNNKIAIDVTVTKNHWWFFCCAVTNQTYTPSIGNPLALTQRDYFSSELRGANNVFIETNSAQLVTTWSGNINYQVELARYRITFVVPGSKQPPFDFYTAASQGRGISENCVIVCREREQRRS